MSVQSSGTNDVLSSLEARSKSQKAGVTMLLRPRHYLLLSGCIYSVPSPAHSSITMIYLRGVT